jgi:hypothetical protein
MNNKQLIKVIKTLVEAEVAKRQEHFLSKTFPKILEEQVNKKLKEVKGGVVPPSVLVSKKTKVQTSDPFQMADNALTEQRQQPQTKQFTKNEILNKVLNQTTPFSKEQRSGGSVGTKSVLDRLPQQTQPIQENTHVPSYMDAEPDIDQTVNMSTSLGAGGPEALRAQMAHKMGYQTIGTKSNKSGLGVKTGLPGLDRILNRDNSELVKKFKR